MLRLTSPNLPELTDPDELAILQYLELIQYSDEPFAVLESLETGAFVQTEHNGLRMDGGNSDTFTVQWKDNPHPKHYRVVEQSYEDTIDIFLAFLEQDEGLLNEPDWMDVTSEVEQERAKWAKYERQKALVDRLILIFVACVLLAILSLFAWISLSE